MIPKWLRDKGVTKTTIYAALNFLAALLLYLGNDSTIKDYLPDASDRFLAINGAIVLALRFMTSSPVFKLMLIAVTLAVGSNAYATPITVDGPHEAENRSLCILEVNTTGPRISVVGVPNDGSWSYFKIEKKIILVPKAKSYTFVVSAADDKTLDTVVVTLPVKDGTDPNPSPSPSPSPESSLSAKVGAWAATLEGTTAVGRSFSENAALPYSTLEDLIERTLQSNQKLNINREAWSTSFFVPLQGFLEETYNANPQTDFIPIWREIGAKLQAIGH